MREIFTPAEWRLLVIILLMLIAVALLWRPR